MLRLFFAAFFLWAVPHFTQAQVKELVQQSIHGFTEVQIGLRAQQALGLYVENGISAKFLRGNSSISYSLMYYSSRFGTAWGTNAIPQDNFLLQIDYNVFKNKPWPVYLETGIHVGYFRADYGSAQFNQLDQSAFLSGVELTLGYRFEKVILETGFGHHLNSGDGIQGPGTLYPFFYQITLSYRFKR